MSGGRVGAERADPQDGYREYDFVAFQYRFICNGDFVSQCHEQRIDSETLYLEHKAAL